MVVFGAGASFDSIPSRPPIRGTARLLDRPPLANELFDDRPEFVGVMNQFPECKPIIPYLRNLPQDRSVEQVLEELQAEVEDFGDRLLQLTAIRLYLRNMIGKCERRWNQIASGLPTI